MVKRNKVKGVSNSGDFLRIQFTWGKKRYRPMTNFNIGQEKQAAKLLAAILFDLENERFKIAVYQKQLKRPEALQSLDVDYVINQQDQLISELIAEQQTVMQNKLASGTIQVSTFKKYSYAITTHILPHFGHYRMSEINAKLIEQYINSLGFTKKRLQFIVRPLNDIFVRLLRHGDVDKNPVSELSNDSFTNTRKSDYQVEPFTLNEIATIINSCDHDCIRNFIQFGFWTGCRISEIFALTWDNVDFGNEVINITHSQTINRQLKEPKTKSGIRKIEMTPQAKTALQNQFKISAGGERVFLTPTGKIWPKPDNFGRYWKVALTKAGIKYRNPYQLRHTFISMMLQFGNSPLILYRMVGHENTEMIYKNYARFIPQEENKKLLKLS